MADVTEDDIIEAEKAALDGVTSVRHADKTVAYDPTAREREIQRAKQRLRKKPLVSLVSPRSY